MSAPSAGIAFSFAFLALAVLAYLVFDRATAMRSPA